MGNGIFKSVIEALADFAVFIEVEFASLELRPAAQDELLEALVFAAVVHLGFRYHLGHRFEVWAQATPRYRDYLGRVLLPFA